SDKGSDDTALVVGVYVNSLYRGRGLGTLLMEAMLQEIARHKHIKKVRLLVNETQRQARELYEKLGFVYAGKKENVVSYQNELYVFHSMYTLNSNENNVVATEITSLNRGVLATSTQYTNNIIQNGSFEKTGSDWLSPWTLQVTSPAAASISQDQTAVSSGGGF